MILRVILISLLITPAIFAGGGNKTFEDFNNATKQLLNKVYNNPKIENKTIYCNATFDKTKRIINPNGFKSKDYSNRESKVEWEHIVPAEEFGKNFHEWTKKDERCEAKGLYGRNCAKHLSQPFRYMHSDLYNIYPSIGALNASRSNYEFIEGNAEISKLTTVLNYFNAENTEQQFGMCPIIIKDQKVIPPNHSKGMIARAYLYMDATYDIYHLQYNKKKLFKFWSAQYPVTPYECARTKLVEKIQKNRNKIVRKLCKKSNLW